MLLTIFVITKKTKSVYTSNLKASNGKIIDRSESHISKEGRETGIASVKQNAPASPIIDLS